MVSFPGLLSHFEKHKGDTRTSGILDYYLKANRVLREANENMALPGKKNSLKIINPKTQEVVVYSPLLDKLLTYYVRRNLLNK